MRRAALLATLVSLGLLVAPATGAAQDARGVLPDTLTDAYRTALLGLRDTVSRVRADLQLFGRDLQAAGDQTVIHRARRVSGSCEAATTAMESGRSVFLDATGPSAKTATTARELTAQMRDLARTLREHCVAGLAPQGPGARADSLRAWGPYRTGRIQQALRAYDAAAARFADAVGIKLGRRSLGERRGSASASEP